MKTYANRVSGPDSDFDMRGKLYEKLQALYHNHAPFLPHPLAGSFGWTIFNSALINLGQEVFMTLFYSPGACSMAGHIALLETKIPHKLEKVDLKAHTYAGGNYYDLNPKGAVPALKLDDGQLLTENVAILQYIAGKNPAAGLAPATTDFKHYRLQEWLGYLAADVHKSFGPLFNPQSTPEEKEKAITNLKKKITIPAAALDKSDYLMGDKCTVPDFYLYVMLTWTKKMKIDLGQPSLDKFIARMSERPSVEEAAAIEAR